MSGNCGGEAPERSGASLVLCADLGKRRTGHSAYVPGTVPCGCLRWHPAASRPKRGTRCSRSSGAGWADQGGAPGRIRTRDRRIRSPMLCPAELRAHGARLDAGTQCMGAGPRAPHLYVVTVSEGAEGGRSLIFGRCGGEHRGSALRRGCVGGCGAGRGHGAEAEAGAQCGRARGVAASGGGGVRRGAAGVGGRRSGAGGSELGAGGGAAAAVA